jgi:transcriptional regulator with XRE-family HTH domain
MSGELQKVLGQRLREHRIALGLSQEQFADELGFHRTYVGSLERGERNVSLQGVEDLAEKLGLRPADLLI